MTFTRALSTNNYGPSKFIVDGTTTANGTHSTIAAALTSASSGDTIFIRPGTYTENLTLKAGVNLTAFGSDSSANATGKVIISGTCTLTAAGSVTISGIQLQTNSAALLAVTGAAASIVNLENCYLNCTNNTGITFSSSSSSAAININNCFGDLGANGITLFSHSSAGNLSFFSSRISNSGLSTTASTGSAGRLTLRYSSIDFTITTSATCIFLSEYGAHTTADISTVALTHGGSTASAMRHCYVETGTASALSISTTLFVQACILNSGNTNIATGAGTILYTAAHLSNANDGNFNVTTQTVRPIGPSVRIGCTNSGAANTLTVDNASNTASSTASCVVQVAGGTASDPTYKSIVSGVTTWTWGADNSDSDAFVVAQGSALGTNNIMRVSTAGEINYPLQPAFLAVAGAQTDVTGDGTAYTLTFSGSTTFDQNSDFDGTSTFTAPVTGKYLLISRARIADLTAAMTLATYAFAVNGSSTNIASSSFGAQRTSGNVYFSEISYFVNLTAADAVTCVLTISNGTKVADIQGGSFFSGYLVC